VRSKINPLDRPVRTALAIVHHYNGTNTVLVKFIKHNQNIIIQNLKKLVLSSSGSWHKGKTPCQESGRMRGSVGSRPHPVVSRTRRTEYQLLPM